MTPDMRLETALRTPSHEPRAATHPFVDCNEFENLTFPLSLNPHSRSTDTHAVRDACSRITRKTVAKLQQRITGAPANYTVIESILSLVSSSRFPSISM